MMDTETHQTLFNKLEGKHMSVNLYGEHCNVYFVVNHYGNARFCLELREVGTGEPFGTLTCNLPGTPLEDNEIIVKTWSENESLARAAMESGLFKDTGKRVKTGFVEAQIWEVL